jgi:Transposase IS116/IS110/IS902 family
MSRFPREANLISWAGLCPKSDESAGKRRSNRMKKVRGDAMPDRPTTDSDGIGGSWSSQQQNPSISWLGKGKALQSRPQMGQFLGLCCCAWQTVGVLPMKNRFTVSRTGEGVLWGCFRDQKGNSE